ncbi:MAG: response regulator [Anaerolineales bacterium]
MSKGRILVVEDNMDTYELVRFFLEKNGYETFLAVNGRDGVDATIKQLPDLIMMDLAMPEMDGWTATKLIKQNPSTSAIPVIALTARATESERARALEAGCDDFLTKPIDLYEMVEAVNHWLGKE